MVAPPLPEIAIVPDVLADGHSQGPIPQAQYLVVGRRFEIAVLVENIVSRQEALVETIQHLSSRQERGTVEQRSSFRSVVGLGQPDEHRGSATQLRGQSLQNLPTVSNEARLKQQVSRQVAQQGEFRSHHEIRALLGGFACCRADAGSVSADVADDLVELEESDSHLSAAFPKYDNDASGVRDSQRKVGVRGFVLRTANPEPRKSRRHRSASRK